MDPDTKSSNIKKSPVKSPRLIILDLDGLFSLRIYQKKVISQQDNSFRSGPFNVFIRNGSENFINQLIKQKYKLAFYTSTTHKNANPVIKKICKKNYKKLDFIWARDRTHFDPDPIKSHDTIKNISDVWDNPVINRRKKYGPTNTIIIDDSMRKIRFNNKSNCILVSTYDPTATDKNFFPNLLEKIQQKFIFLSTI